MRGRDITLTIMMYGDCNDWPLSYHVTRLGAIQTHFITGHLINHTAFNLDSHWLKLDKYWTLIG